MKFLISLSYFIFVLAINLKTVAQSPTESSSTTLNAKLISGNIPTYYDNGLLNPHIFDLQWVQYHKYLSINLPQVWKSETNSSSYDLRDDLPTEVIAEFKNTLQFQMDYIINQIAQLQKKYDELEHKIMADFDDSNSIEEQKNRIINQALNLIEAIKIMDTHINLLSKDLYEYFLELLKNDVMLVVYDTNTNSLVRFNKTLSQLVNTFPSLLNKLVEKKVPPSLLPDLNIKSNTTSVYGDGRLEVQSSLSLSHEGFCGIEHLNGLKEALFSIKKSKPKFLQRTVLSGQNDSNPNPPNSSYYCLYASISLMSDRKHPGQVLLNPTYENKISFRDGYVKVLTNQDWIKILSLLER